MTLNNETLDHLLSVVDVGDKNGGLSHASSIVISHLQQVDGLEWQPDSKERLGHRSRGREDFVRFGANRRQIMYDEYDGLAKVTVFTT